MWYRRTGEGVQWNSIDRGVSVDDNFALLHVILMLLLDCVIYACIAWYVEAVYPGEYGVPRPFYFPLLVSYLFMRPFHCVLYNIHTLSYVWPSVLRLSQSDVQQIRCYNGHTLHITYCRMKFVHIVHQ